MQRPENPNRRSGRLINGGKHGYKAAEKAEFVAGLVAARAGRTPEEQLARLDARLGVGQGAERERKKLLAAMAKPIEATKAEVTVRNKDSQNLKGKAKKLAQQAAQALKK